MFHEMMLAIKNCRNEQELLKIVSYISANQKKLKLDAVDIEKLESIGMRKYHEFERERSQMIKNKKQGFNNFDE